MGPVRPTPPRRARLGAITEGLPSAGASWRGIVLVDNYDSFTRNLADGIAQLGADVAVVRNDRISVARVLGAHPRGIVLSPGPKAPVDAGICLALVRRAPIALPILGVCLGHQVIGEAFGGRIVRAGTPVHGRALAVRHEGRGLLAGLPSPFLAARYHSLVVDRRSLPAVLEATAWSDDGALMALRHRDRPVEGVQFHPESFLTSLGPRILAAFLRRCGFSPRSPRAVVR